MPGPDKTPDIAAVRRQAATGGLAFEAYLPPGLADWVIGLVEEGVFHSPAEAVFVAMQSFRDLEEHPDVKRELLNRILQTRIEAAEQGRGMSGEDVMTRLRNDMAGPRAEPAVWDSALDRPLCPEDPSA
jgi:hypothetical protein